MPCDGLTLAILIGGDVDLGSRLDKLLQLLDLVLLPGRDDVQGFEVVVYVDPKPSPCERLVGSRDLGRAGRQVTDVAYGGLDREVLAEDLADRLRLGRRLDDH